jgi:DNA mismatch repair protein MutL
MADIIHLLPDSVANQIAAGEVIQRPASAAKEMLENAVDAGATSITLIIKDAGKSLIRVVDNGSGMTFGDARMCFERHATSKIDNAGDLFKIRSKGFRGEALASIAAIAQVELKTRRHEEQTGSRVIVEGSKVTTHEAIAGQNGTSVSIKNLFFNTPARRNFLKSNASETRHVLDEFHRIALSHPDIAFSLIQESSEVYRLQSGNFRQRITALMGKNYNERLVPVQEETSIVTIDGFVGKPEFARKTRGEQYFFVNNRFIKDPYLNHAVVNAFEELLLPGTFPSYFITIGIDPSKIDVNIHPTKTEIKFEDERSVYSIVRASVKRALGKFSVSPSLDFDQENSFAIPVSMYGQTPVAPKVTVNPSFNPFHDQQSSSKNPSVIAGTNDTSTKELFVNHTEHHPAELKVIGQLALSYILCYNDNEAILIDQQAAHERITYEELKTRVENSPVTSQQELFPVVMEFSHNDYHIVQDILPDLKKAGFDINEFGKNTIVIAGLPTGVSRGDEKKIIEEIVEQYRNNIPEYGKDIRENLLRTLAVTLSVKWGQKMDIRELQNIAGKLRYCKQPNFSPSGKATFVTLAADLVTNLFNQKSIK